MSHDVYQGPWQARYASPEMLYLFSDAHRYRLWRRLWILLAEAQQELGLDITDTQIAQLRAQADTIDFDAVRHHELRTKHDVMAHIHAYGDQCPDARGVIHLGATSCYVTDNADILIYREALELLLAKMVSSMEALTGFAEAYASSPCLGLTHLQPAMLTTIGKRACLWLQDLLFDAQEIARRIHGLRLLGIKGAVGTQASFMTLFNGDAAKVAALEQRITTKLKMHAYAITGQTYPRKQDSWLMQALSGVAVSAHKFGTDVRLLSSRGELYEPFGEAQVGSSAMPYKKNPVLCERLCGLARYAITLSQNGDLTAALQWLERSLDDSSNRRLVMPELFLCIDSLCNLCVHLFKGLQVDPLVVARAVQNNLPFLATETILMAAVSKGGDRQLLHERLRIHSFAAAAQIRQHGVSDLLDRISADPLFNLSEVEIGACVNQDLFVGCAPQQVMTFLGTEVRPFIEQHHTAPVPLHPIEL